MSQDKKPTWPTPTPGNPGGSVRDVQPSKPHPRDPPPRQPPPNPKENP